MKKSLIYILILFSSYPSWGQELLPLGISDDQSHLIKSDSTPFFWLGDTAWELIHRLTREEIDTYLRNRAGKGFTVIQTVILAELDGLTTANAYGAKALIDYDPSRINEAYFELVDYTIEKASELGLYIGLLPTWGDKFNQKWGSGPVIFTAENANTYGQILGQRYKNSDNIIWVLGGDRIPEEEHHFDIIRAMARGIKEYDTKHLMTYHPSGSKVASSFFTDD